MQSVEFYIHTKKVLGCASGVECIHILFPIYLVCRHWSKKKNSLREGALLSIYTNAQSSAFLMAPIQSSSLQSVCYKKTGCLLFYLYSMCTCLRNFFFLFLSLSKVFFWKKVLILRKKAKKDGGTKKRERETVPLLETSQRRLVASQFIISFSQSIWWVFWRLPP